MDTFMVTPNFNNQEIFNFLENGEYPDQDNNKRRLLRKIREKKLFIIHDGKINFVIL